MLLLSVASALTCNMCLRMLALRVKGAKATGWKMSPSRDLSFTKINLVGWMSGSWTQKRSLWQKVSVTWGSHFSLGLPWLGGSEPCPFFIYTLTFSLRLRKTTENLSQGWALVESTWPLSYGVASTGLLTMSPLQLPVGDFSQPLSDTSSFQLAEKWVSSSRLTSTQSSQSKLWCGRQRIESPNNH
jgi:hypothetical protein